MSKAVKHLQNIRIQDEYGTPLFLFQEYCKHFDFIPKVDYFASPVNHVVQKYYTMKENSFEKDWTEDGFVNPPYSQVKKVMEKAYNECSKYHIRLLILVYAKTDTDWWHEYIENNPMVTYKFQHHRIKFLGENGQKILDKNGREQSAPYPSVWIFMNGKEQVRTPCSKCGGDCAVWCEEGE